MYLRHQIEVAAGDRARHIYLGWKSIGNKAVENVPRGTKNYQIYVILSKK